MKKATHWSLLSQLAAFSVGCEKGVENMTPEEVDEALTLNGVDLEELKRTTQEAIRKAKQDMDEWREASRPDPEKMREPLGPIRPHKF